MEGMELSSGVCHARTVPGIPLLTVLLCSKKAVDGRASPPTMDERETNFQAVERV